MLYGEGVLGSGRTKWLYGALVAVLAAGCGDHQGDGPPMGADGGKGAGPRQLAPLSGSRSGSRQPVFSFIGDSAHVDLCHDRACTSVIETLPGEDGAARPDTPLPAGTVFWRVATEHAYSAVWQLVIPSRDSGRSTAFGTVPDYNGDGFADVAIGAPAAGSGSVPVFFGGPFGPGLTPDLTLSGGDAFGRGIAAVGDVNGDGFVDLAVSSGPDSGTVTIYDGGPTGPGGNGVTLSAGPVTVSFGTSMASAGDVDGDGYGDVVIGGGEVAQVFFGGPDGISTTAALTLPGAGPEALVVQGYGDVNGDGAPDIEVDGTVYLGGNGGFTAQAGFDAGLISSFSGDVDGDGLTDFIANQAVLPGTPSGVDPTQVLLLQAGEQVLEAAGDVDADGYSDVVSFIGPFLNVPELERVYFGAPTSCGTNGCRAFSALSIPGHDRLGGNLGAIIAPSGDLNGDNGDDLVVSTPENGSVFVYRTGDARQLPLNFAFPTLTGAQGSFGSSLAGLFGTALPSLAGGGPAAP
jgi:hypothetical protein